MALNAVRPATDQRSDHNQRACKVNVIYFLGTQDGETFKIGRTDRSVAQRMAEHAGRGPNKALNQLVFLAAVPGINSDETAIHNYFKQNQLDDEREWFKSSDDLRAYVRWLRMQWFTLRSVEECDTDEIARSHDGIDGSMWLPNQLRTEYTSFDVANELYLALDGEESNAWRDVIDVEPEVTGDDFYTHPKIVAAARKAMGGIDLDPATHPVANRKHIRAPRIYTLTTNGLIHDWYGRVWCNPPFGQWKSWSDKVISEWNSGRVEEMCVLIATRSITGKSVAKMWRQATLICFTEGRIPFWGPKANSSPDDGHAIFYFGHNTKAFCNEFRAIGHVVRNVHGEGVAS